jgi:hypothetical protein
LNTLRIAQTSSPRIAAQKRKLSISSSLEAVVYH